ncbi:sodium/proton antiporter, NhaA family [Rhizobiales bacterium GAS188]|nr:sodium/proton antiporter, NhaA family [Rhizobiales bacterium GAS188]
MPAQVHPVTTPQNLREDDLRQEDLGKEDLYGGIALGVATLAALVIANSSLGPSYNALFELTGEIRIGSLGLSKTLEHWINDGLMAVFFLLIGLEIKREALAGELADMRKAALPLIAATGGFVVPTAIYAALNWGDPQALRGWAVPSVTDIAFAIGICAFLGRAVPASLRAFLLALAIIDDLMAIVVIAVFYTDELSVTSLALAGVGVAALASLNLLGARNRALYVVVGVFTWVCVLKSGVHATLAGVAVGFAMPLTRHGDEDESPLEQTEHALKPWISYAIVPIFAFANAGVSLTGVSLSALTAPVPLGIIAGLFVGKQLGVFGACLAAIKLGIAARPAGASIVQLYGVAVLTGIGFTMSLFIGTLAIDDEAVQVQIRLAVLAASILSGIVAAIVLSAARQAPGAAVQGERLLGDPVE